MSNFTAKIFQTGAMLLEKGKTGAEQSNGWGGDASRRDLTDLTAEEITLLGAGNCAFPWLSFGTKLGVDVEEDNSVTSNAFRTTSRMIGNKIDNPLSMYNRFDGLGRFLYWMFGFENDVQPVVAFKGTLTGVPVVGETGWSDGTNDYAFFRTETSRGVTMYVFKALDSLAPALQTGTMTKGAANIVFTSHSTLMYEHTYELDGIGRHFRDYTTAEQAIPDWETGDKKNLMATFGKRMGGYDIIYRNAMCKNFSIMAKAAGLSQIEASYVGYDEYRLTPATSEAWKLPTALQNNQNVPAHHQSDFSIGTTAGNQVLLGLSDFSLAIETPLQILQDYISGLFIAEPVLEQKYGIKLGATISRHSVPTYQAFRDGVDGVQTPVCARWSSKWGFYAQEILIRNAVVTEAGPSDDNVATEPLNLSVGAKDAGFDPWAAYISNGGTNPVIHDSPVVMRVRNFDPQNWMFAV